jgi:hypothetical protein
MFLRKREKRTRRESQLIVLRKQTDRSDVHRTPHLWVIVLPNSLNDRTARLHSILSQSPFLF